MGMSYIGVAEGIERSGLRLVLSPGLPGPWSVAAKAVFDVKGISYAPVAQGLAIDDPLLRQWTGQDSAPAAMLDDERPRTRYDEIILLAERLRPEPPLVPGEETARCEMFGLLHAVAGEDGFGWNFRLHIMQAWEAALSDPSAPAFLSREQVAMMRKRYGDASRDGESGRTRMRSILRLLASRLHAQRRANSRFFVGAQLSALDLYWTAFSNLVAPMRHDHCPMPEGYRAMGDATGSLLKEDLDPILIEHREQVLLHDLETPLQF